MVRYVFFILSLVLFASCEDYTDTDSSENGDNVVSGVWDNYYNNTDSLVLTRVFTPNFYSYFIFADGKPQEELNKQKYRIKDDLIILSGYTQKFSIIEDTLWITNSKQDQVTKYIKNKNLSIALEGNYTD